MSSHCKSGCDKCANSAATDFAAFVDQRQHSPTRCEANITPANPSCVVPSACDAMPFKEDLTCDDTALEKTLDLCAKGRFWRMWYDHPDGHATSNMLNRLMRSQNGFFNRGPYFHGDLKSSNLRSRAWAILHNYWPWSPTSRENNGGATCPVERLNKKRYAENWLENLLVATSFRGTKNYLPKMGNNQEISIPPSLD